MTINIFIKNLKNIGLLYLCIASLNLFVYGQNTKSPKQKETIALTTAASSSSGELSISKLPQVVLPSPEIATMSKMGNVETSLHTGAASAAIPIFELNSGKLKLPIILKYLSNGIKVNDIASRVGLGWSLEAGGNISRVIHDEDDENPSTIYMPPPNFTTTQENSELFDYLVRSEWDHYDTERDEYYITLNGVSGKFYKDKLNYWAQSKHTSLKINRSDNNFILTDAAGIKYFFGNNNQTEFTNGHQTNGMDRWDKKSQTGWFITRILSPDGDEIIFEYLPISIRTLLGPSQNVILSKVGSVADCGCTTRWGNVLTNQIDYDTRYLTNIKTSNGDQVQFIYENRNDLGYDNRVKEIQISSNSDLIKKIRLKYDDFNQSYDWNQRFYLKKITTVGVQNHIEQPDSLTHEFEYYNPSSLPSQKSLSQDYFGYYNGKDNANFFPKPSNYFEWERASEGGNREPDFGYAVNGSLKKIIYPTKGSEEFIYEPHTIAVKKIDTTFKLSYYNSLTGTPNTTRGIQTATWSFSTNSDGAIELTHNTFVNPNGPQPGQPNYWEPDGLHEMAVVDIFKTSNNQLVHHSVHKNYNIFNKLKINLSANTNYAVKISVWGYSVHSEFNIKYNAETVQSWVNMPVCGIRVKKIMSYIPGKLDPELRLFKYASHENLSKSSGIGYSKTQTSSYYQTANYCSYQQGLVSCNNLLQISSSSLIGAATYESGTPVAYGSVIETSDTDYSNGAIEHVFYTVPNILMPQQILGSSLVSGPNNINEIRNGLEEKTIYLNKKNGTFLPLKIVENQYSISGSPGVAFDNYIVRKRYDPVVSTPFSEKIAGFDVGMYSFTPAWIRQTSQITTIINQETGLFLIDSIKYEYGNNLHSLPIKIIRTNSKGENIVQLNKYPSDFSDTPYQEMVTRNIISPIIQSTIMDKNGLLSSTKTSYKAWNFQELYKPDSITTLYKGGSSEARIIFSKYDIKGNILEQKMANGVNEVYVWGYNHRYPIAKIIGSDFSTVSKVIDTSYLNTLLRDSLINIELQKLRVDNRTKNAIVNTYTYKPLVGITSETNPAGITVFYEYDSFGRLKRIKDNNSNVIKQICYNYAGQQVNCNGEFINYFSNIQKSKNFIRNNCGVGFIGVVNIPYTVPAGKYTSTISQADADQQAQNDVDTNGQAYANSVGLCVSTTPVTINLKNEFSFDNSITQTIIEFVQNGSVIQTNYFPYSKNGNISINLPAGTYQLRVYAPALSQSTFLSYTLTPGDVNWQYLTGAQAFISGPISFSVGTVYTLKVSDLMID